MDEMNERDELNKAEGGLARSDAADSAALRSAMSDGAGDTAPQPMSREEYDAAALPHISDEGSDDALPHTSDEDDEDDEAALLRIAEEEGDTSPCILPSELYDKIAAMSQMSDDDDDDPMLIARELEERLNREDDPDDGKGIFGGYIRLPAFILLCVGVLAGVVHLCLSLSTAFSDFMSGTVGAALRFCLAKLSGVLPFSLAETLIFMLPVMIVLLFVASNALAAHKRRWWRFFFSLLALISFLYSLFVFSFVPSYNCTKLEDRLGLDRRDVSAQQLYDTALVLTDDVNSLVDDITFTYKDASIMPYDIDELSDKICEAYDCFTPTHSFIQSMHTRIKPLAISPLMTYTHIAGVYAFYTGESNLNTNFPDYTIPYTTAHELAHQRGIAREDEANFVAYLVCMESDDPYIRYSASVSVLEYVYSALAQADTDLYNRAVGQLDLHVIYEMQSYSRFFSKYAENTAATVSGAVNDTFLKLSGQSAGSKSYGLVVDLAVAYLCPDSE